MTSRNISDVIKQAKCACSRLRYMYFSILLVRFPIYSKFENRKLFVAHMYLKPSLKVTPSEFRKEV